MNFYFKGQEYFMGVQEMHFRRDNPLKYKQYQLNLVKLRDLILEQMKECVRCNKKPATIYIGPNQYIKLTSEIMESQCIYTFELDASMNDKYLGLKLIVLPYIDNIIVVPE
jgi:hypothetical protein